MNSPSSVSPLVLRCPVGAARGDQLDVVDIGPDDDVADGKMAMPSDPIVGVDRVVFDDATGPGALPAKPLPSPKGMSALQRATHDLTHLPYDPSCEICVSCRRPNSHHRTISASERSIPLLLVTMRFQSTLMMLILLLCWLCAFTPTNFSCVVSFLARDEILVW